MEYRAASSDEELLQILQLQQANLYHRVSPEIRETQGFLKVEHNLNLLRTMQSVTPQVIALDHNQLAGYALSMNKTQANLIPELTPLFSLATSILEEYTDYVIMGQICVAQNYRGQGNFSKLYHTLKTLCKDLPIITEIASINQRSLRAHMALGFEVIGSHQEIDFNWQVVMWK